MESIRKELGEDEGSVVDEYRAKIEEAGMPEAVREQAEKELARLERMGDAIGRVLDDPHLPRLADRPCRGRSAPRSGSTRCTRARCSTPTTPASRTSRTASPSTSPCASCARTAASPRRTGAAGAILTLIGPPGTGKTSIGESIARATGREFVRMSLGGVRDEAEIRGHRRTYIGALPGRLVRALRDAGTMNPVILLDEVDKVGADWRGDPSAALLEVLDPAQNHSFRDHYLDVELDLSEVLFIATANMAETIPGPLLDRMEVVRFDGYTTEEKVAIARGYLLAAPARAQRPARGRGRGLRRGPAHGRHRVHARGGRPQPRARARQAAAQDRHPAGRRRGRGSGDDRRSRPCATRSGASASSRSRPSAPRCRAWRPASRVTGAGGDVLFIEATSMPGKEGFVLTGQLGDVMKESARIALSYVRGHADQLGIADDALRATASSTSTSRRARSRRTARAPAITMTTALASLLTGRPVKHTVGMTGEVTLQGRVLPIGGLKQKVLAAHAAGLTDVILPERNRGDLDDVPEEVREQMTLPPGDDDRRGARAGAGAGAGRASSSGITPS